MGFDTITWTCCCCEKQVEETFMETDERMCMDCEEQEYCEHENKTYQQEELENNVPESYTCDDCGKDLDIPEPDWDLMRKGK